MGNIFHMKASKLFSVSMSNHCCYLRQKDTERDTERKVKGDNLVNIVRLKKIETSQPFVSSHLTATNKKKVLLIH